MSKEAMKLSLEALEPLVRRAAPWGELDWLNGCKAITALREALAEQPAQQCKWPTCQREDYQQALAEQIKRELVGEQPPQRKPLPKNEWPKHPSSYWNDEYIGFSKSDLTDYAMQVLAAHNIKEKNT